jgi:hypothetical protein
MIFIWLLEQSYWKDVFCVYLQELLYLYGFVADNNPDDYLMVTLIVMYVLKVCNKFVGYIFGKFHFLVNM